MTTSRTEAAIHAARNVTDGSLPENTLRLLVAEIDRLNYEMNRFKRQLEQWDSSYV